MANPVYQYSNGIDLARALPALQGRIGWLSDAPATPSGSGRYLDDGSFHALVSESTYRAVQPKEDITDPEFAELKDRFLTSAILRTINTVFTNQKPLDRAFAYDEGMRNPVVLAGGEDVLGYRIEVPDSTYLTARILQAVLWFTQDTPVTLYLWRGGDPTPIWETTVQASANKRTVVPIPACYLSYGEHATTSFTFGFNQSELQNGARPLVNQYALPNEVACVAVEAFRGNNPTDDAGRVYLPYPHGLNVEIAIQYDYTEAVIQQPEVFDELVGLTGASMVLEQILYTNRSNAEERAVTDSATRIMMQLDLTGSAAISDGPSSVTSLRDRITQESARVKEAFSLQKTGVFNSSC